MVFLLGPLDCITYRGLIGDGTRVSHSWGSPPPNSPLAIANPRISRTSYWGLGKVSFLIWPLQHQRALLPTLWPFFSLSIPVFNESPEFFTLIRFFYSNVSFFSRFPPIGHGEIIFHFIGTHEIHVCGIPLYSEIWVTIKSRKIYLQLIPLYYCECLYLNQFYADTFLSFSVIIQRDRDIEPPFTVLITNTFLGWLWVIIDQNLNYTQPSMFLNQIYQAKNKFNTVEISILFNLKVVLMAINEDLTVLLVIIRKNLYIQNVKLFGSNDIMIVVT